MVNEIYVYFYSTIKTLHYIFKYLKLLNMNAQLIILNGNLILRYFISQLYFFKITYTIKIKCRISLIFLSYRFTLKNIVNEICISFKSRPYQYILFLNFKHFQEEILPDY